MGATASLAAQLRTLSGEVGGEDGLFAGLSRLSACVSRAVPSCLAVSIILVRLGAEIPVSILVRPDDPSPVLASLAMPLSAVGSEDVLVLRAAAPGAFLLLAEDLDAPRGPGQSAADLDQHLCMPSLAAGRSQAVPLAAFRATNRAIGVLVDRGFSLEAAGQELQRLTDEAGSTLSAAARVHLAALVPRAALDQR